MRVGQKGTPNRFTTMLQWSYRKKALYIVHNLALVQALGFISPRCFFSWGNLRKYHRFATSLPSIPKTYGLSRCTDPGSRRVNLFPTGLFCFWEKSREGIGSTVAGMESSFVRDLISIRVDYRTHPHISPA